MNRLTWARMLALVVLALLLAGCGHKQELRIQLPEGTQVLEGGDVFVDNQKVGYVQKIDSKEKARVATVAFKKPVPPEKLRDGLRAIETKGGVLQLDSSKIGEDAKPLASDTVLVAEKPHWLTGVLADVLPRYLPWMNVAVVGLGLVVLLVLFLIFRALLRLGVVLVSLTLAVFSSVLVYAAVTPVVRDHVYPTLERYRNAESRPVVSPAPTTGVAGSAQTSPKGPQTGVKAPVAPTSTGVQGGGLDQVIRDIPLPSPSVVSFVACTLILFVFYQLLIHVALRRAKKPA